MTGDVWRVTGGWGLLAVLVALWWTVLPCYSPVVYLFLMLFISSYVLLKCANLIYYMSSFAYLEVNSSQFCFSGKREWTLDAEMRFNWILSDFSPLLFQNITRNIDDKK